VRTSSETLESLEFPFVRGLLAGRTVTPMGRPLAEALVPLPGTATIARALDETDEAVSLIEALGGLPLRGIAPVEDCLATARPEGSVLTGVEILAVTRFAAVNEDVRSVRKTLDARWPLIGARVDRLPDLREIVRATTGRIAPSGDLLDSASPELGRIRARIQSAAGSLRERLATILEKAGEQHALRDAFITERNGRFVIPVRSDAPVPVRGIVHGGSSSGATLFVEPLATVELNNELVQLRESEIAEIERILRAWTSLVRAQLPELDMAIEEIAWLDFVMAKGALARDLGAIRPVVAEGEPLLLRAARHPLLERTLRPQGKSMVPIDVALPAGTSTLIVSGPNAGGKTIVLKTTGLCALMAHAGLRVPAEEARIPVLQRVLVDIGDRQSIEGSLSTFSAHIQNLASITASLDPPCLVLIDEIGTGTDPVEGGALAIALLEHLRAHGALTIATTHHGPVKVYGIESPGVASASVEFDDRTLAPTYRLLAGIAGASAGLAIAERLGLDPAIVADARARIAPADREGEGYLFRLRELLAALEEDRRDLEAHRAKLEAEARRAREEAIRSDNERAERYRGELARALEEFKEGARRRLASLDDKRDTIRLDKERARREAEIRREFERLAQQAAPAGAGPGDGARARRAGTAAGAEGAGDRAAAAGEPFAPAAGATVLVGPYGREGRIESIDGSRATVLVGSARFQVRLEDCLPPGSAVPEGPARWKTARGPSSTTVARELSKPAAPVEINLIGCTVEEGTERLDKFLDDAAVAGHREVRVVHGHGTGRLRIALRDLLASHPHVESLRPGNPNEGGNGATVVRLGE